MLEKVSMAYVAIPQKRLRVKAVGDLLEPSSTGTAAGHHQLPTMITDGDANVETVQDQKHQKLKEGVK